MTCKEFRKLVKSKTGDKATAAERMAVIAHQVKCRRCHKWLGKDGYRNATRAEAKRLLSDILDPEAGSLLPEGTYRITYPASIKG